MFAALLEHSHDGIVISEAESGWMLECSWSFVMLTGYARHELLGRTSVELGLIDPEIRAAALESTLKTVSFQLLAGNELLLTIVRDITSGARPDRSAKRAELDRDPARRFSRRPVNRM